MPILDLSKVTIDFDGIRTQLENHVAAKQSWKGFYPTQTGQTLLELIAAVGTLNQVQLLRYSQDAFSATALNDDAIYAIASSQGVRINRKLPMQIKVTLTSKGGTVAIPEYTQFQLGGIKLFNRAALTVTNNAQDFNLYEGTVVVKTLNGLGSDYQAFRSEEDAFTVSDTDVKVELNGEKIEKELDGVWKLKGASGYRDRTEPDGRMLLEFGNDIFGSKPGTNDLVKITYVTCNGLNAATVKTEGKRVKTDDYPEVTGLASGNPRGGANQRPAELYKNISAPSFGTFGSAVTKNQYLNVILGYPSVLDGICFSQREVNPTALEWMNLVKVVVLTSTEWGEEDKRTFIEYLEKRTMYATRFFLEAPTPVKAVVSATIYCHTWANPTQCRQDAENAVKKLFEPKQGMLGFDIYKSDVYETIQKSNSGIEYVVLSQPYNDLVVSGRAIDAPTVVKSKSIGTLDPGTYYYAVSPVLSDGEIVPKNFATYVQETKGAIQLFWAPYQGAVKYKIWGRRANTLGLVDTIAATSTTYIDPGYNPVTVGVPATNTMTTKYNRLSSVSITSVYSNRSTSRSQQV